MNLTQKIIKAHLIAGDLTPESEISLRIDQTLTQDSTGTMAYLQFEAMGIPRVKTEKSVAYIDHNLLQTGAENADDHKYIETIAKKHGIVFSKPGNGICHQVHLERFAIPGKTLLGSDSHTPTCGGMGMLAIGAGGLDVAAAMGTGVYSLTMPKVVNVHLTGSLPPWVSAKDVILEILSRLGVKGGVGKILEYTGEGVVSLSVPQRATIANMGAELGATTSLFPSDESTRRFLRAQGREEDWAPFCADDGALYDEEMTVELSSLVPLAACPHSPDAVKPVADLARIKVDQVAIGSCTNSSYEDMMAVAALLKGKTVHPDVSLVIAPGSRQVLGMLAKNGALADIIAAGARVLECGCGPCIGMGQSPATGGVSLRTFNRNFLGRSGTKTAQVYLCGPETAVASALSGHITDPRSLGTPPEKAVFSSFAVNDNLILPPAKKGENIEVVKGPNIKPFPQNAALAQTVQGPVLTKLADNITTDHIMPSDAKLLPFRSNIPYLADFCLTPCDPAFPEKAKEAGGGFIVAGENYGQGSSREHAALAPLQLGIKGVLAKSFARIHRDNLLNNGILPLTFLEEKDYDLINPGDTLAIENAPKQIAASATRPVVIQNKTTGRSFFARLNASARQTEMLLHGGLINVLKEKANKEENTCQRL